MGPAFAGGHHIAMGVEGNGFATLACWAKGPAHDQVGDGLKACSLHPLWRDRVHFGLVTKALQQLGSALGVGGVVAGRGIGGDLHQRA